jgi:hypothetical protein
MAGGCAQTGVKLVEHASTKPQVVLVEVNGTIYRGVDTTVVERCCGPGLAWVRSIPALQAKYRPSCVVIEEATHSLPGLLSRAKRILKAAVGRSVPPGPSAPPAREQSDAQGTDVFTQAEDRARRQVVDRLRREEVPLSASLIETLNTEAAKLREQIRRLEESGCRVLLFTVPRDSLLDATPLSEEINSLVTGLFPNDVFTWIPSPATREWRTNDGWHLIRADAVEYARHLRGFVSTQMSAGSLSSATTSSANRQTP